MNAMMMTVVLIMLGLMGTDAIAIGALMTETHYYCYYYSHYFDSSLHLMQMMMVQVMLA